ncbi:MAG: hypothetical protein IJH28_02200 [Mogibacterium sp.]|nr:hypothetical protein [Mogibacterium sp.]MBQ6500912.1 hypothetical protein [Mogibacterium sp.]
MNNKKGGFGAKFLLVLILMIASAVGGAYGYRILDGKMASRDALKAVENVDVSDYDTAEQSIIQGYIDEAKKDLETAKTRKEVYEIISDFVKDVDKVQTKAEKELEAALKEAEEAKKRYGNNDKDSNSNSTYDNNGSTTTDTDDSGYKSNSLNSGSDDEEESGGLLNSLFGGMASGSGGN